MIERTLDALLDARAAAAPDVAGLTFEDKLGQRVAVTYAQLADRSAQVAAGLAQLGVSRGERVVVHLGNCLEAVLSWFGLARLDAIFVPSNTGHTAAEVSYAAQHCGARFAIGRLEDAELLRDAGFAAERIVLVNGTQQPYLSFTELLATEPVRLRRRADPTEPLELIFTSGTTSRPKAATITHANCIASGEQKAAAMHLSSEDRVLSALPLFHVNAQSALLAALTVGASFIFLERYSASRHIERLAAHRATVTSFVGMQVRTLLRQAPSPTDRAHAVNRAWFAINVTIDERDAFEERFGIHLLNGYGLTEAFTSVTQAPLVGEDRWPSVGLPLPGREVRIIGADGEPADAGEVGEIVVGGEPGSTIMADYWDDPEATRIAIRDGWLHTGDLGWLDADGYLYFAERKANMIKRSGENIAAQEVETVLLAHPAVIEAAVVGVPDPIRDQAVKAFVVAAPGTQLDVDELTHHCRERLAAFKIPTVWCFPDTLPKSAIGKVERRRLLEQEPIASGSIP